MTQPKQPNLEIKKITDDLTNYDFSFKIILIGDSNVGKSCITIRSLKDTFNEKPYPTLGVEFFSSFIMINKKIIKLHIWDTCGQEIYRSVISNFYKNVSLAVLVYSISSLSSFNNIKMWVNEVKSNSSPQVKLILLGNKSDLNQEREVSWEMGVLLSKEIEAEMFYEVSARSGLNISQIFEEATKVLYYDYMKFEDKNESLCMYDSSKLKLVDKKKGEKGEKGEGGKGGNDGRKESGCCK